MKTVASIFAVLLLCICLTASAQDNYLLPENFYLHKGEKLNVHLVTGNELRVDNELKFSSSDVKKLEVFEGKRGNDVIKAAKDSAAPVVVYSLTNSGLTMVEMVSSAAPVAIDREVYAKFLSDEGLVKLADQVNNSNQSQFREKSTRSMKTLVMVDKPTNSDFDKPSNQDLEIVLKGNPYKVNYGDNIDAILYAKNKPVVAATINLYIKAPSGNVYPQTLSTDAEGRVSFVVNREGLYMLRTVKTDAATNNTDFDFQTLQAAYTFYVHSQNDMPNDYHSFGLGNMH